MELTRISNLQQLIAQNYKLSRHFIPEAGIDAAGITATALEILQVRVATATRTRRKARARKLSLLR